VRQGIDLATPIRHMGSMEGLRRDLSLAVRSLLLRPGFAAVVCLTLGLGIGANTAVFSVVDTVLLRALPYANPDELVVLWGELPEQGRLDAHLFRSRARRHLGRRPLPQDDGRSLVAAGRAAG
jgi:hypothetical protein